MHGCGFPVRVFAHTTQSGFARQAILEKGSPTFKGLARNPLILHSIPAKGNFATDTNR